MHARISRVHGTTPIPRSLGLLTNHLAHLPPVVGRGTAEPILFCMIRCSERGFFSVFFERTNAQQVGATRTEKREAAAAYPSHERGRPLAASIVWGTVVHTFYTNKPCNAPPLCPRVCNASLFVLVCACDSLLAVSILARTHGTVGGGSIVAVDMISDRLRVAERYGASSEYLRTRGHRGNAV